MLKKWVAEHHGSHTYLNSQIFNSSYNHLWLIEQFTLHVAHQGVYTLHD